VTRQEALGFLRHGSVTERLEAAVVLRTVGEPRDAIRIRRSLLVETDERVRTELIKSRLDLQQPDVDDTDAEELSGAATRADAYARGVRDTSMEVVHELRRLVGFARGSASRELRDFESSDTRRDFDRVSDLMEAIERLGEVAGVPLAAEFDLGGTLAEHATRIQEDHRLRAPSRADEDDPSPEFAFELEMLGPPTILVRGDHALVELCFRNGLLNAAEATLTVRQSEDSGGTVTVNWGVTDTDCWVAILDDGPGLPVELRNPFAFAQTTKAEHLGVGLTLTHRAVSSMSGRVDLQDRPEGGAVFEFRWPHERADT
jgi:signal transduction histidine kinase